MIIPDVNVLVHAHRADVPLNRPMRAWLESTLDGPEPLRVPSLVLSGFVRIVTHPRIFSDPTPLAEALAYCDVVLTASGAAPIGPGPRHWSIFRELCAQAGARGNVVPDAYLAAIAVEHGAEWITTDRDYARFRGLRWRNPLAGIA